jgi:predicted RNase H-like HicB family nuclease
MKLTAIIEAEGDGYVSLCPELDIASQGDSIEQARDNLREALELFFECASSEEAKQRLGGDCLRHPSGGCHWVSCVSSQAKRPGWPRRA